MRIELELKRLTQKVLEIHGSIIPHPESKPYTDNNYRQEDLKRLKSVSEELEELRKLNQESDLSTKISKLFFSINFLITKSSNDYQRSMSTVKNESTIEPEHERKANNIIDELYIEVASSKKMGR